MGLGSLVKEKGGNRSGGAPVSKRYGGHEYEDKLWEWYQELNKRFPIDVELEFIEVSPQLKTNWGKLYTKETDDRLYQYIRIKEGIWEYGEWRVRQHMLYLMVHAYFKQTGMDHIGAANDEFKWVCGQVGAAPNGIEWDGEAWKQGCTPFLEEDGWLCEYIAEPVDEETTVDDEIEDGGPDVPPP